MNSSAVIFRFGPYELRSRARELYKHGVKLRLRPQPFQVLQILLEHAGDVVTREELHQQLWASGTFVDFEHGLNTSVKELRGVLGDSATEPRYIETLPRLGYRVIVPVEVVAPSPASEGAAQPQTAASEDPVGRAIPPERIPARSLRRWPILVAISLVLIATLGAYFHWSRSLVRPQPPGGRLMLAVLPFENLTGDAAQDYFSDGLTEEMISQLGSLDPEQLGVIARTSVMHYKNSQTPLEQIWESEAQRFPAEPRLKF